MFQNAVDMIVQGRTDLIDMVTPRLPWDQAVKAFEMYAYPAEHEGSGESQQSEGASRAHVVYQ